MGRRRTWSGADLILIYLICVGVVLTLDTLLYYWHRSKLKRT